MRNEEDDTTGSNLQICRFRDRPEFRDVTVDDACVDVVDQIDYRANSLIIWVNSPYALHGVTDREPTRRIRRYINFLAELREPVFDLTPYQH